METGGIEDGKTIYGVGRGVMIKSTKFETQWKAPKRLPVNSYRAKREKPIWLRDGLERDVIRALTLGMDDGVVLTIECISGFELFGAYETWREGWKVTGKGVTTTRYFLEEALIEWMQKANTTQSNDQPTNVKREGGE